jgi:hypothetical protein
VYKWGGITFAVGILLIIIEVVHASKKKEGVTPTDRKRIMGLFWLTCSATALVAGLIWLAD